MGVGSGGMISRLMVFMPLAVRAVIIFVPIAPLPPVTIANSVLGFSFCLGVEGWRVRYRSERVSIRAMIVPRRMDILALWVLDWGLWLCE